MEELRHSLGLGLAARLRAPLASDYSDDHVAESVTKCQTLPTPAGFGGPGHLDVLTAVLKEQPGKTQARGTGPGLIVRLSVCVVCAA